jgi:ferredoxin
MLVIDPGVCIHCGVCVPECPAEAIRSEDEPDVEQWLILNAEYVKLWPVIARKGQPPADAKLWDQEPNKFDRFFSSAPGQGS